MLRRWFLVDRQARIEPIFLGVAEHEATIRRARHVTFSIHPSGVLVSAAQRDRKAWTAVTEGRA